MSTFDDWFLTPAERGNPDTRIDGDHAAGRAYTTGNLVRVLIDGDEYFRRLHGALNGLEPGDAVWFTDWRGDADERLDGPESEIGDVLAALARRGVDVRALIWRSHSDHANFSADENRDFVQTINCAGGEALLDERVHRAGCHHQKLVVLHRRGGTMTAFVGGIDLSRGRHDDDRHLGDDQPVQLDEKYGPRPAWHDAQVEVVGPATLDVALTFRERWSDPTALDHRPRWHRGLSRAPDEPRQALPLPPSPSTAVPTGGSHAVQVLRTYPKRHPAYPFARDGERSIARAYLKAFSRAQSLIYIEDQYLWSPEAAQALAGALRRSPDLRVIAVVPCVPDRNGLLTGPPYRIGQEHAIAALSEAAGDRVAVYDLENERDTPIYVHAKVCVVDDVWLVIGSDNLNRRSWTNDSEVSCAIIDETIDKREPRDPGQFGDGARALARETRLRLWHEHAGVSSDDRFLDPIKGFDALAQFASNLDAWHARGQVGPRPAGRLRQHHPMPVRWFDSCWAEFVYRRVVDPDGRPRRLRRARRL